jgi:alcohol dehydrogenase (NADP+)
VNATFTKGGDAMTTQDAVHTFANGDAMQLLGLGTWKSEPGDVGKAVREAIRVGYRHIDCASFYGNEAEIGLAIRDAIREGEVTRKDLWITSKLWCSAHGKKNVGPAIRKSLSDLGLDYLDMYMVHWPVALKPSVAFPSAATDFASADEAPMQDTWGALEAARAEGLTRHIGVSNFSAKKIGDLLSHAKVKPEVNQIELHPFLQQKALVDYCSSQGIHVTAYSSLGSGDRPAFLKSATDPVPLENPVIKEIARAHERTAAQVLLAWHVQRGISTLAKSINPTRLRENFAATELRLTAAELTSIKSLDQGFRFIAGAFWAIPGSPWTLENLWDEPQKA